MLEPLNKAASSGHAGHGAGSGMGRAVADEGYLDELREDAAKCVGLARSFDEYFLDGKDSEITRRRATNQIILLKGLLWKASIILVDELLEDLKRIQATADESCYASQAVALSGLPERFAGQYDSEFTRKFIASTMAITTRFTTGWVSPVTVAEELATRLLLDQVQVSVDTLEVRLNPGWREDLERLFFEDDAHESLYYEDEMPSSHRAISVEFEDWFIPFHSPPRTVP